MISFQLYNSNQLFIKFTSTYIYVLVMMHMAASPIYMWSCSDLQHRVEDCMYKAACDFLTFEGKVEFGEGYLHEVIGSNMHKQLMLNKLKA